MRRYRIDAKRPGQPWEPVWDEVRTTSRQAVAVYRQFHAHEYPTGTRFRAVEEPGTLYGTDQYFDNCD